CVSPTAHSSKVPRDRALGNLQAQFQQLSVDSGRSPGGILLRHARDELTKLEANPGSALLPVPGKEPPIEPNSGPMPSDDGLRLHDHQHRRPPGPDPTQKNPEHPIPTAQSRPHILALKDTDLMAQRHDFKSHTISRANERHEPPK